MTLAIPALVIGRPVVSALDTASSSLMATASVLHAAADIAEEASTTLSRIARAIERETA